MLPDLGVHLPVNFDPKAGFRPPPPGQAFTDQVFGTEVWHVAGNDAQTEYTEYARQSPVNIDGSLVATYRGGVVNFRNTAPPFNTVRTATLPAESQSDRWWHGQDPDIFLRVLGNRLVAYSVATGGETVLAQFPYGNVAALGEGQISNDGSLIALVANGTGMTWGKAFVWDIGAGSMVAELDITGRTIGEICISPTGQYVILSERDAPGRHRRAKIVHTIAGNTLVEEYDMRGGLGHADVGLSPQGDDWLVAVESWHQNIVWARRLADNTEHQLQAFGWHTPGTLGCHISANAMHVDGYVTISTYVIPNPVDSPDPSNWFPFSGEVYDTQFNDPQDVQRWCHGRGRYDRTANDTYYGGTLRAQRSRDGRYRIFNSNMLRRTWDPGMPADHTGVYLIDTGASPTPPPPQPPPGGNMGELTDRKTALSREGITFKEVQEMNPPTPTGRTILEITDDSGGDKITEIYRADETLADADADPAGPTT